MPSHIKRIALRNFMNLSAEGGLKRLLAGEGRNPLFNSNLQIQDMTFIKISTSVTGGNNPSSACQDLNEGTNLNTGTTTWSWSCG